MTNDNQSLPPLLPNFDTWHPEDDRPLYSYEQMRQYGDARAAHARKQALQEAVNIADRAANDYKYYSNTEAKNAADRISTELARLK